MRSNWEKTKIGNIVDIRRGASPRPIQQFLSQSGMPWVKIADATSDTSRFLSKTNEFIIEEGISKSVLVEPETLIVSNSATPGLPKIMKITACVHDGWLVFSNYRGVIRDFLYYKFTDIRRHLVNQANGSVFQNLKTDIVRDFDIDLPPLATQKQIAKVLSALDDKIELNNKINDNLEEQAQALYNNQFAKLDKNGKLKDIIYEYSKSKINVSKAKGVVGDYPFYTSGRAILQYPTYLVSGRNCYLNTGGNADVKFHIGKASYSTDTWCITGTNHLSDYLYLLLSSIKTELNNKYFEGSALKHLQKNNLRDRKIYIPSHNQILKFNKLVYPIFDCIMKNTKENRKLAQLRDTLLPRLMSGELDVSNIEI